MGNLGTALKGQLPEDTIDLIKQRAAEFGVASGMPGSELAGNQGLRTLGLTSLNRMQGAESLLAPYAFREGYTYAPQRDSGGFSQPHPMDPAFAGTRSAPMLRSPAPQGAPVQQGGANKGSGGGTTVGNLLSFMPNQGMSPMGNGNYFNPFTDLSPNNWNSSFNSPGGGEGGDFGSMIPFMGSSNPNLDWNFDTYSNLADMGIIDPAFGEPDFSNFADFGMDNSSFSDFEY